MHMSSYIALIVGRRCLRSIPLVLMSVELGLSLLVVTIDAQAFGGVCSATGIVL